MKRIFSLIVSALCAVGAWAQNAHNGHEYVDLGLSSGTLWATCNIGATNASDAGDYYQWGDTETHYSAGGNTDTPTWKEGYSAGYNWSTYKWCNGSYDTQTKYCTDSSYGTVDNKKELEDADDVAVQTWGGAWKMPTYEQQTELRNECYWVWTSTYNGENVNGYIVYKAKKDGDKGVKVYSGNTPSSDYDVATDVHIFLPAAGLRWATNLSNVGNDGYYWSRSLSTSRSNDAYDLNFNSNGVDWGSLNRRDGFSVRPVCASIAQITIGEETTKYYDVEEFLTAFKAINGTATVKLLGDINVPAGKCIENKMGANITLDLNGHNIKGSVYDSSVIEIYYGNFTIKGEGTVVNTAGISLALGVYGKFVVNGGTYSGTGYAWFVFSGYEIIINDGKFQAPALCEASSGKAIVKGGLFSMDPSNYVADGYKVVANDDEVYKFKVVSAYPVIKVNGDSYNVNGIRVSPETMTIILTGGGTQAITLPHGQNLDFTITEEGAEVGGGDAVLPTPAAEHTCDADAESALCLTLSDDSNVAFSIDPETHLEIFGSEYWIVFPDETVYKYPRSQVKGFYITSPHQTVVDEGVEATCTVAGLTEGSHCSVCHEIFVAQEGISAPGHKVVVDEAIEPTCTKSGLTEGAHCSVCGEVLVAKEEIEALGHKVVVDEAIEPTCTESGLTEGAHCSVCGEVLVAKEEIEARDHMVVVDEPVIATCTEDGLTAGAYCSVCHEIFVVQDVVPALGHQFTKYIYNNDATTEADGTKTAVCDHECGATDTRTAEGTKLIATGIKQVSGNSQKTIKTIENGKVVIIKNGEKWDVSGRKM
ncbi:MAG: hypothetical protein MJZ27_09100 [Bacteroidales bacterium]|nr:hypothetical protein [Bacteroidales bacterium]